MARRLGQPRASLTACLTLSFCAQPHLLHAACLGGQAAMPLCLTLVLDCLPSAVSPTDPQPWSHHTLPAA